MSQQTITMQKALAEIRGGARAMLRSSLHPKIGRYANSVIEDADSAGRTVDTWVTKEFDEWIRLTRVIEYPIAPDHVFRVTDNYFQGAPPFKGVKNREDIPDSFIWQTVVDIVKVHNPLHLIVHDGALFAAAEKYTGLIAHKTLDEFIELPECQKELKGLAKEFVVTVNLDRIMEFLRKNPAILEKIVKDRVLPATRGEIIQSLPFENVRNRARIVKIESYSGLPFEFESIEYYGAANIGIPFLAVADCNIAHLMPKSAMKDWWATPVIKISVRSDDDPYFDAVSRLPVGVEGKVSFEFDTQSLDRDNISEEEFESLVISSKISVETSKIEVIKTDH